MKYGIFSANEFLYTDSYLGFAQTEAKIDAASDSFAAFQIACKPKSSLAILFTGDSKLNPPEIFMELPVTVERNTDTGYNGQNFIVCDNSFVPYAARKAPFKVFDVLLPIDYAETLAEEDLKVFYVKFSTKNLESGNYKCALKLIDGEEETEMPIEICVHSTKIPQEETLRITNWFHPQFIETRFDAKFWSEKFWAYIKEYGQIMRYIRQTDIPFSRMFFDDYSYIDGKYIFDFSKAEKFIKMYFDLGFKYVEGPIMMYRLNWHYPEFYVKINGEDVDALSEKGTAFLRDFFTQWYAFLKENSWEKLIYQHVGDEPGEHCLENYSLLSGLIRECMPNVPIIEALANASFCNAVDVMVPKSVDYLREKQDFDMLKAKRPMWFYTCCEPGGEYLNRLLDQELLRGRLLHWANFIYGFEGFLHWGLNYYIHDNPYHLAEGEFSGDGPLPAGDTHIVYYKDGMLLGSMRMEMMRMGAEDFELLKALEKKNPMLAKDVADKIIRSFEDYTKNAKYFDSLYKQLLINLDA